MCSGLSAGRGDRSQAIAGLVDGMTTTKGETKEATRRDGRKWCRKSREREAARSARQFGYYYYVVRCLFVRLGGRSEVGEVESLGERAGGLEEAGI